MYNKYHMSELHSKTVPIFHGCLWGGGEVISCSKLVNDPKKLSHNKNNVNWNGKIGEMTTICGETDYHTVVQVIFACSNFRELQTFHEF